MEKKISTIKMNQVLMSILLEDMDMDKEERQSILKLQVKDMKDNLLWEY